MESFSFQENNLKKPNLDLENEIQILKEKIELIESRINIDNKTTRIDEHEISILEIKRQFISLDDGK